MPPRNLTDRLARRTVLKVISLGAISGIPLLKTEVASAQDQTRFLTSFEEEDVGDQEPVDDWYLFNDTGIHEVSNARASHGSQSFRTADATPGTYPDPSAIAIDLDLTHIEDILFDVYAANNNPNQGNINVSLDNAGTFSDGNINIWGFPQEMDDRGESRYGGEGQWWRDNSDQRGVISDTTGVHPLIFWIDGDQDVYWDNIRLVTTGYGFTTDGLYVYGRADEIGDEENNDEEEPRVTHDQFFTAVDRLNASDVFLQWVSLYETEEEEELISTEKITTFLRKCSDKDIRVHSMVDSSGKEELNRVRPRIKDLIEWQQNRSQDEERFSGLHLDLEPGSDGMNLFSFLAEYNSILNWLKTESFNKVSIAIGPWWKDQNPFRNNLFYDVRDHEKVDFLVIMAHADDAGDARDQIRKAMRNPDGITYSSKDFMWSVLLLEMDEDSRTFYEEGGDAVSQAITSIENPPPISESQYKGTVANAFLALSHYKS